VHLSLEDISFSFAYNSLLCSRLSEVNLGWDV
jgi:hypothetical protein